MHSIFSWNNVSINGLIIISILAIIVGHSIFSINKISHLIPEWILEKFRTLDTFCFARCYNDICKKINNLRGENYYLTEKSEQRTRNCLFTMWEFTHILLHIFLGYYYNIYISLGISFSYEIYEYKFHKAESYLDPVYNLIGFLIGTSMRYGNIFI